MTRDVQCECDSANRAERDVFDPHFISSSDMHEDVACVTRRAAPCVIRRRKIKPPHAHGRLVSAGSRQTPTTPHARLAIRSMQEFDEQITLGLKVPATEPRAILTRSIHSRRHAHTRYGTRDGRILRKLRPSVAMNSIRCRLIEQNSRSASTLHGGELYAVYWRRSTKVQQRVPAR